MTPTITRGLRTLSVPEDQFQQWVNLELLPLLREMRQALNYTSIASASIPTDGSGTATTIWSSADLAVGTSVMIKASVVATTTTARSAFIIAGLFRNTGLVGQEGATATIYSQNTAGVSVTFAVASNHVNLVVDDTGFGAFEWTAVVEVQEAP